MLQSAAGDNHIPQLQPGVNGAGYSHQYQSFQGKVIDKKLSSGSGANFADARGGEDNLVTCQDSLIDVVPQTDLNLLLLQVVHEKL
jgi:hypothetical protein